MYLHYSDWINFNSSCFPFQRVTFLWATWLFGLKFPSLRRWWKRCQWNSRNTWIFIYHLFGSASLGFKSSLGTRHREAVSTPEQILTSRLWKLDGSWLAETGTVTAICYNSQISEYPGGTPARLGTPNLLWRCWLFSWLVELPIIPASGGDLRWRVAEPLSSSLSSTLLITAIVDEFSCLWIKL